MRPFLERTVYTCYAILINRQLGYLVRGWNTRKIVLKRIVLKR